MNTCANVDVLRMLSLFVLEEFLYGIAIIDAQYDRSELQIKASREQHWIGRQILHAEPNPVVLYLDERLVNDASVWQEGYRFA